MLKLGRHIVQTKGLVDLPLWKNATSYLQQLAFLIISSSASFQTIAQPSSNYFLPNQLTFTISNFCTLIGFVFIFDLNFWFISSFGFPCCVDHRLHHVFKVPLFEWHNIHPLHSPVSKVCMCYSVIFLSQTSIFDWFVDWWGSKNNHLEYTCSKEIGLHLKIHYTQ